jgi:hypothetical protein
VVTNATSNGMASFGVDGNTGTGHRLLFSHIQNNQNAYIQNYSSAQNSYRDIFFLGSRITFETTASTFSNRIQVLTAFSTGNVAINTTTDAGFKLDVNGTARVTSLTTMDLVSTSPNQIIFIKNSSGTTAGRIFPDGSILRFSSSNSLLALSVFANANIGIGQATDAGFKLDVNGTARSTDFRLADNTLIAAAYTMGGTSLTISNAGHNNATGISVTSAVGIRAFSSLGVSNNNALGASIYAAGGSSSGNISLGLLSNRALITSTANGLAMHTSSMLQVDSTTQGFLPPRMTTTQKNAIASPAAGLVVYDTTLAKLCVYTTTWETITSL